MQQMSASVPAVPRDFLGEPDCVVTVLLGPPPELGFDTEEQQALDVLAQSGAVALVTADRVGSRDYAADLEAMRPRLPH